VEQLATKAVTLGNRDSGIGYFQACKALSEYRGDQFSQAVEWAEKARTNSELFARAEGCAVLAMAEWRLGLKDVARAALDQGDKLAPDISSNQAADLGDGWLDWLVARILLNEATELIGNDSTLGAKSNNQHREVCSKTIEIPAKQCNPFGIHERGHCFVSCGGARRFQGRRRAA